MLASLISLATLIVMAAAALALGRPLAVALGLAEGDRLARLVWSGALGLMAVAGLLGVLGVFGLLYPAIIGGLTAAACLFGLLQALAGILNGPATTAAAPGAVLPPQRGKPDPHGPISGEPPRDWLGHGLLLAATCACAGALLGALAPPVTADGSLPPLELSKTLLVEHGFSGVAAAEAPLPNLTTMWQLWALALDGAVAARLVGWGLGLLLALATVVLAAPLVGGRWAWLAGAAVASIPMVSRPMTIPCDDLGFGLYGALALAGWWRAIENQADRRCFIAAATAAVGALAIAPAALLLVAAMAGGWVWEACRRQGHPLPRRRVAVVLAAGAAAVTIAAGLGFRIGGAWTVGPADSTVQRAATTADMASDGLLWLAAVPGLLWARRLRGLGVLLLPTFGYLLLWLALCRDGPRLMPLVPPLAVVAVWVWIEMRRFPSPARCLAATAFAVMLGAMAAVPLWSSWATLGVALGVETREDYLLQHEPSYPAAGVAGRLLPAEARILSQDPHTLYFPCRVARENDFRRLSRYDQQLVDSGQLSRQLRAAGFSHLLLMEPADGADPQHDPTLSRLVDAQLATDQADALFILTEYRHQSAAGAIRRYRLMMLR